MKNILSVLGNELRRIASDAGVLIFFVFVPLVYPLVYTFIYTDEVVREVPVIAVDADHTARSRRYLRLVDASPDTHIIGYATDMEDARRALAAREAYGIIFVPENFSAALTKGEQAYVNIFTDTSGLLYYKALLMANTSVSLKMNAEIKVARSGNSTAKQDQVTEHPIGYKEVSIFNPQNGFASFLIPAVLILILQQTLLLGTAMSAGTEREMERRRLRAARGRIAAFARLAAMQRPPIVATILGKGAAHLLIYLPVATYVLGVVPRLFSLNQIGRPLDLALFIVPFLIASIFFALSLAQAFRRRETCMLTIVFTSVPLLFLTGISWPSSAIPDGWRIFSAAFPSTFGVNGFVKINNMGATLADVRLEWIALWVQATFYFFTACAITALRRRRRTRRQQLRAARIDN